MLTRRASASGSSPLARGLRSYRSVDPRPHPDHPRSRGVYPSYSAGPGTVPGSSPLARGLRVTRLRPGRGPGIIPARAGFTRTRTRCRSNAGDHPRSRGVYDNTADAARAAKGSSPLARGLQHGHVHFEGEFRIIPARAGFTLASCMILTYLRDHPRSRGVYALRRRRLPGDAGSSPLARGLRVQHVPVPLAVRIIPARAGFTAITVSPYVLIPDHPRSRGVYSPESTPVQGKDGSSPLARGLRLTTRQRGVAERIIPARAGFTIQPCPC